MTEKGYNVFVGSANGVHHSTDFKPISTGYAFALLDILRGAGLSEGDYKIERVGGMVQRFNALVEGLCVPKIRFGIDAESGRRNLAGLMTDLLKLILGSFASLFKIEGKSRG